MRRISTLAALLVLLLLVFSGGVHAGAVDPKTACTTVPECPAVCMTNCSGQTPTPLAAAFLIENYLSRPSTLCGSLPVEYPDYRAEGSAGCPVAAVERITASAVDMPSLGVIAIIAADGGDPTHGPPSFVKSVAATIEMNTAGGSPLRASGLAWKYRRTTIFPEGLGDGQGYVFQKLACDAKDSMRLNVSAAAQQPSLLATAMIMNGVLTSYAVYATATAWDGSRIPPSEWPVSADGTVTALARYALTLGKVQFLGAWLQEHPERATDPETDSLFASAASHAVVLHVSDYALNLSTNAVLPPLRQETIDDLRAVRDGAAAAVERICNESARLYLGDDAEPLLAGVRVQWADTQRDPARVAVTPVRARDSIGTSVFISALGPRLLGKHCFAMLGDGEGSGNVSSGNGGGGALDAAALRFSTAEQERVGVLIAERLVRRALRRFGLLEPGQSDPFKTLGIVYTGGGDGSIFAGDAAPEPTVAMHDNCTVDVAQTAWVHIAANHFQGRSETLANCSATLRASLPYRRTMCSGADTISSWQEGFPVCGGAVPSYALSAYSATAWLIKLVFRTAPNAPAPPPTPVPSSPPWWTPSPTTSSNAKSTTPVPGSNNGGGGNGAADAGGQPQWQQPVIGLCIAAVIAAVVFFGVRYLRKQTHHREARLASGDDALVGAGGHYGATSAGHFM